jgi:hypothetical protein
MVMQESRSYEAIGDSVAAGFRTEAALAIIEAGIACLRRRHAAAVDSATARDVACQLRDAIVAKRALLSGGSPD